MLRVFRHEFFKLLVHSAFWSIGANKNYLVRKSGFRVIDVETLTVLTVTGQELTPGIRVGEISEDSCLKSGISGIQ